MKNTTIRKFFKRTSVGSSLAELAVVTAIMGTLTATASAKFSIMTSETKIRKSQDEINKMLKMAMHHYNLTESSEGAGRFPGQFSRYEGVGEYNWFQGCESSDDCGTEFVMEEIIEDLEHFNTFVNQIGMKWVSVFGIEETSLSEHSHILDDELCCPYDPVDGHGSGNQEWMALFNGEPLSSLFEDGHFIYIVVPGYGHGYSTIPPTLIIADLEDPSKIHSFLTP